MQDNNKNDFGQMRSRRPAINSLIYGKVPPQSPELEEAVIGAMLLEKDCVDTVIGIIPEADCFYVDANVKIYAAIIRLYNRGSNVDLLTVTEELMKTDELDLVGGAYHLTKLTMAVVSGAHVEQHAMIVMEKHLKREAIMIAGKILSDGYEDSTDVFDLIDEAEAALSNLTKSINKKEPQSVGNLSRIVTNDVLDKKHKKITTTGISTGYKPLDEILDGWQETDLVVLAARPGVGKTALVLNLLDKVAEQGHASAMFSLEMGYEQLVTRLQSARSTVPLWNIKRPASISDAQEALYLQANKDLQSAAIFIDDTAGLKFTELRAKCRKLKAKHDIKLVAIDYLQLMRGNGKAWSRENEIATITGDLKALAKELKICIIALSQLNRSSESSKDNKPKLSQLRESGAIEQDADRVLLLYRASAEEEKKVPALRGPATIDIAKNRHGDTDEVELYFEREIQKWHEYNPHRPVQVSIDEPVNHYKTMNKAAQNFYEPNKTETEEDLPF